MAIDPYGFEKVSFKLEEAEFFLGHIRTAEDAVLPFYVSAFLAAARSVRDSMKRLCDQQTEARDWFRMEDKKLHDSEAHDRFRSIRNTSVHEGDSPINAWTIEVFVENGAVEAVTRCHVCSKDELQNPGGNASAFEDCREHFAVLLRLGLEAHRRFGSGLDPHHLSQQVFVGLMERNKTDAIEH